MQFTRIWRRAKWIGRGVLFFTPLTSFYMMQFVFGSMPWELSLGVTMANYICIGAIFFLLTALTNRLLLCSLIVHLACIAWGVANYFVTLYRGLPVLPWDFTALRTAVAVAGSYDFTITWEMAAALSILVGLAVLIHRSIRSGGRGSLRQSLPARLACLLTAMLCFTPILNTSTLGRFGVHTDVWDQAGSYRTSGVLTAFLRNFQFMKVEEPQNASPDYIQSLMETLSAKPELLGTVQKPNIIAIMNESWADYEHFDSVQFSESLTDHIEASGALFGHAYASVFGAGTSASEFEFLTGNSMAFLPSGSIPYQQYLTDGSESLASILSGYGYDCLAIHPGERTSWQRNLAYPKLGFDAFKCEEDLAVPVTTEHGYISDATSFEQILWEFEQKEPGQPLFLFNVTIQNHGSYTDPDYPAEVTVIDFPGEFPKAEQYLTLANKSDEAFQMLVDYFSEYEEPTIILMFGDHQPSVEQEFLDLVYNVGEDGTSMEEYMRKYEVPYLIWANYNLPAMELPTTSLNFLGQQLLRLAGIPATGYGQFLWGVQNTLPAICFPGYTDAEGNAYSHLEHNDFTALIEGYRAFQYNNLFGGENRLNSLYDPEPAAEGAA